MSLVPALILYKRKWGKWAKADKLGKTKEMSYYENNEPFLKSKEDRDEIQKSLKGLYFLQI